ncbi:MAG: hypothetical protein KF837_37915 [Labilithrix sp.]|nr:hypothetical protein [Labilithrix sp.]
MAIALSATACRCGESSEPVFDASESALSEPTSVPPPPPKPKLVKTWEKKVGFKAPESVLHDVSSDLYFVTNVEGKPLERDNKAFVSKVAPEADGVELKWIEAGKKGVTLHAPKGMALSGETLFVADIDTVRLFDRRTGAPAGEVKVPGATSLDDVAAAPDGRVFVSDTGMKDDGNGGVVAAGTDAVYVIGKDRKVDVWAKSPELDHPNGLVWSGVQPYAVSFGKGELYAVENGTKSGPQSAPAGMLDGLVLVNNDYWVTSWAGKAVYRTRPNQPFVVMIEDVRSPADLGYDRTRRRLLVPLAEEDELRAYEIELR